MWMEGIIILLSYFIGCFNTGFYYVKLVYKQDIRDVGSNVTGAFNVSRIGGKKGFILTFLGDALKGAIPVILCRMFAMNDTIILLSILAVLLGHIFPVQLKFRGGKGLSTAVGAFLAFHPIWVIFWLLLCIIILPWIRRYTITCLFALMILPLVLFIGDYSILMIAYLIIYAILISFACRENLKDYIRTRAYQGTHGKNK